jgi:hypothetical protein
MQDLAGPPRVRVYLDSTRKVWSVTRRGRVADKPHRLLLGDVRFVVSERARARARKTGRKTPHAYVEGVVLGRDWSALRPRGGRRFGYNPFVHRGFTDGGGRVLEAAKAVYLEVGTGGVTCVAFQPKGRKPAAWKAP